MNENVISPYVYNMNHLNLMILCIIMSLALFVSLGKNKD
jgi:hypothetical protein